MDEEKKVSTQIVTIIENTRNWCEEMTTIKFIKGSGGLTTTETLLDVINKHPEGSTIKQLSRSLNRPVSMINLSLKTLVSKKQVKVRLSNNKMQRLIYPKPQDKRSILIKLLRRL